MAASVEVPFAYFSNGRRSEVEEDVANELSIAARLLARGGYDLTAAIASVGETRRPSYIEEAPTVEDGFEVQGAVVLMASDDDQDLAEATFWEVAAIPGFGTLLLEDV